MAALPGRASDRRKALFGMPAGAHTRCATRSWNGTWVTRSAIRARMTKPALLYSNTDPGAETCAQPSSIGT